MFEDLKVGDTYVAVPRTMASVRAPSDPAALGVELVTWWRESGIEKEALVRRLSVGCAIHRTEREPAQGEVNLITTVVRLNAQREGSSGWVTWHHELRTASGELVATATSIDLLRAEDLTRRSVQRDVGTLAWGEMLAARLVEDGRFQDAVATWDGAIGLRSGDHTVELRVYRGVVIEVTQRSPHGATFTVGADDRTWADVLTGPETSFGVRLMRGDFAVSGDPYEYLRLTKALEIIVGTARDVAGVAAEVAG